MAAATALAAAATAQAQVGCLIEPSASSDVSAMSSGTLAQILVERGQVVRRGQVLAMLSSDLERANLEVAKQRAASEAEIEAAVTSRDLAQLKLKRLGELQALGQASQMEMDQAKAELEVAEQRVLQAKNAMEVAKRDVAVAQSQLELRSIKSPIDGVVADRLLNPGERADGRAIFKIFNLSKLRAEVILPAAQFGQVKEGMTLKLAPEVGQTAYVSGQVVQVDRFLDAASGTFRARLMINNPDQKIAAGSKCKIEGLAMASGSSNASSSNSPKTAPASASDLIPNKPNIRPASTQGAAARPKNAMAQP